MQLRYLLHGKHETELKSTEEEATIDTNPPSLVLPRK